jgi:hypothetical protein
MQKGPSTDNQNPSMKYIAGPIEVYYRADGVFGQGNATGPRHGGLAPDLGQETSIRPIRPSALDSALVLLYSAPNMLQTLTSFVRSRLTRQMPVWRSGPAA